MSQWIEKRFIFASQEENKIIQSYDPERTGMMVGLRCFYINPLMYWWLTKGIVWLVPGRNLSHNQILLKLLYNEVLMTPWIQIGFIYIMKRWNQKNHVESMM
jgi:hypothetical protein